MSNYCTSMKYIYTSYGVNTSHVSTTDHLVASCSKVNKKLSPLGNMPPRIKLPLVAGLKLGNARLPTRPNSRITRQEQHIDHSRGSTPTTPTTKWSDIQICLSRLRLASHPQRTDPSSASRRLVLKRSPCRVYVIVRSDVLFKNLKRKRKCTSLFRFDHICSLYIQTIRKIVNSSFVTYSLAVST